MGGYEKYHSVDAITFDVDPATNDLVVGGTKTLNSKPPEGFVYFLDYSTCEVKWMLGTPGAEEVTDIAFAPSDSSKIYGITKGPSQIIWIDNSKPETVTSIKVSGLPINLSDPHSIHLTDTHSNLYFLTNF